MTSRFQLRFQEGERAGETIPLAQSPLSVGRKPGVSIQVTDASVSGNHAELTVSGEVVQVRDLGSTNGTRVAGRRVTETCALAHGDELRFGNVVLVFEDTQLTATAPGGGGAADDLGRVSSQALERAGKGSRLGLWLGAVAVVAGGVWFFSGRDAGVTSGGVRPVEAVAGNLIEAGYSFEDEAGSGGWEADETCPVAFFVGSGAARSGAAGLSVELAPGEWAQHFSGEVPVRGQKQLTLSAWARADGKLTASLGIEFRASGGTDVGAVTAWANLDGAGSFTVGTLTSTVPPGFDSARAVLRARAGTDGSGAELTVDDVALIAGGGDGTQSMAQVSVAEYTLYPLGSPASSAFLHKAGRTFVTALRLHGAADEDGSLPLALGVSAGDKGIEIAAGDAGGGRPLRLAARLEPGALRESVATVGAGAQAGAGGGYRTHAADFERSGVTSLLTGKGLDLVRWKFSLPVELRGVVVNGGLEISAQQPAGGSLFLQLNFRDERQEAGNLAHAARNAERAGTIGDCLATWQRLLDEYPFEEGLVAEAEAARGRLVSAGMAELAALERRLERARFFGLADLFRRFSLAAQEIAKTYAGSEVELAAERLLDTVNGDLALLDSERDAGEQGRLREILTVLEGNEADDMAAALRLYMEEQYGEAE